MEHILQLIMISVATAAFLIFMIEKGLDWIFDRTLLPLVNFVRVRLGKEPLE